MQEGGVHVSCEGVELDAGHRARSRPCIRNKTIRQEEKTQVTTDRTDVNGTKGNKRNRPRSTMRSKYGTTSKKVTRLERQDGREQHERYHRPRPCRQEIRAIKKKALCMVGSREQIWFCTTQPHTEFHLRASFSLRLVVNSITEFSTCACKSTQDYWQRSKGRLGLHAKEKEACYKHGKQTGQHYC